MSRADKVWTFDSSQYSSSFNMSHNDPVNIRVPVMEANTAGLRLQKTADALNVLDADATWDPAAKNDAGTVIEWPASDSEVTTFLLNPGNYLSLGRIRLRAVNASGADVSQVAQVVVPHLREIT